MKMNSIYVVVQKNKQYLASFLEYEVDIADNHKVTASNGSVCQSIKLGHNKQFIIKAKQELISKIHQAINKPNVQLIPYGMVLRVFLIERGVQLNNTIVFVDYQDNCVYLTIIDHEYFTAPRVIPSSDPELVKHEIERTIRHFELTNDQHAGSIRVISNRELGIDHPIQDGLLVGNYDINFELPEIIINRKKREFYVGLFGIGLAFLISISTAAILYFTILNQKTQLEQYTRNLSNEIIEHNNQINSLRSKRIPQLVKDFLKLPIDRLYRFTKFNQENAFVFDSLTCELINEPAWLITVRFMVNRQFMRDEYPRLSDDQTIIFKNSQQGLMMEVQFKYESINN